MTNLGFCQTAEPLSLSKKVASCGLFGIIETGDDNAEEGTGTAPSNRNAVYRYARILLATAGEKTQCT